MARISSLGNPWWIVFLFLRSVKGIGFLERLRLVYQVRRNAHVPGSATSFFEQLWIVREILQLPPDAPGPVAEFGCFRGMATASISLACRLTKRKLVVFDSFEGLPEHPESVVNLDSGLAVNYVKGQYRGSLEEVRANVSRYGAIEECEFVKGFFEDTLPARDSSERFALVFEDADLLSSVKTVLRYAWPRLRSDGLYLCHEARDRQVVELFFNDNWWKREIGEPAPGFIGSGVGVMTGPTTNWCCLGYTVRRSAEIG